MKRKADGSFEEGEGDGNGDGSAVGAAQYQTNTPQEESPEIATKLSFPRLAKLRKDHNIPTEIAVHLSKLHHITKDHKGFYRVRICRTCSGLPHLLELGSYSDLESATLANDVHEFLNHRTRHLHVITEEDIHYIDQISVTRTWRHERTEVKLLELLQERLDKSKINQIRSQQHTGTAYPYGAYGRVDMGGMDPSRAMMNPQMMPGGMPWAMQQGGPMNAFMQQGSAGYMDQNTAAAYMMQHQQQQQQQQRMGGPGQPQMTGNMMGQGNAQHPGMNGMPPGGPPGANGAARNTQPAPNAPNGMQGQGMGMPMGIGAQMATAGRAPGMGGPSMGEAPTPGSVSMTVNPNDSSDEDTRDRRDGAEDSVMDTPNLEKSAAAAIAALCGNTNPYALPSIQQPPQQQKQQEAPKPPAPQPQPQAQSAPTYPTQAQIRAASAAAANGGPTGTASNGGPNGAANGNVHPALAYMAQMNGGQAPGQMQLGGGGGAEGSGTNSSSQLTQQQQMQQMQAYYQQMQAYQMQMMQHQQRMQQGGGAGQGGPSANGGNSYPQQGQQQQGQNRPQMGGPQTSGQHGNPYAMYEQAYGGMPPASMSNPLVASYNAHQAHAFNANENGFGAGGLGNSMMGPAGGMGAQGKPAMGGVTGGDPSGSQTMTDLSEESIQRVTFMTYQFEGAKKLLFSKLSCACAVENNAYYINLIMDSLIALYVAPTYGNPVYAQNAMRAIEYVMNSGALTSGSLYMLVTAYTPGDMEATTEMVRNLHAALKEFETKYEQVECSTRRMNYYAAQLVGYFDQMKLYCKAIGTSSMNPNQLMSDPKAPRLAHWDQMYTKILRCNHNFGLRCDLQMGLPVWWPNSVMPFAPAIGGDIGAPVSNFFKSENVIRSEHSSIRYNYGLVAELVGAFNASGLEVLPDRRQETDSDEVDYSGLENPSVLGSQTLALLLIQYGCSTLAVESLELADFSSGLQSTGATNSLAVNRYPLDRTAAQSSENENVSVGSNIGESCGRSSGGSVDACLKEFARWKKYLELRISDPVVKGMYQNVYMDLLAMQILCTAPVKDIGSTAVKTETKVHNFSYADDDASNILLELSKSSSGTALTPVASPPAVATVAPPNASSNVFSSLLAAIDNVQPLQEKKHSDKLADEKPTVKDPGFAETSVARKIDTNSVATRDLFETIRTVIGDTLATGISGPMFQHPSRSDTNKYAPHFSINHEICLRVNMSYLSVLSVISRRTMNDRSMSESSCGDILETLDAEAIVQSVYRELLFLGEWIDSSDGGCPLFSYTFFSFAICLKSCRILLTAYPSLSETLKKIMTLIPRILTCCGRRKTVCQILLHYQEEVSPRL